MPVELADQQIPVVVTELLLPHQVVLAVVLNAGAELRTAEVGP